MIKIVLSLFLSLLTLSSFANDKVDCTAFSRMEEKELTKVLFSKKRNDYQICYYNNPVTQDATQVMRMIYNLIGQMDGLPKNIMKKWNNLTWDQTRFVSVDFPLCLTEDCPQDAELAAKNFSHKKLGLILLNQEKWERLNNIDKFSLIWHEILGVLEIEKNDYFYSSMVVFKTKCETESVSSTGFTGACYITANLLDPSFVKKKK